MPVLPSGRVVGITSERARWHAHRRHLRVTPQTPHHQLYPLIDVVEQDLRNNGSFRFTGHTVADLGRLAEWNAADRSHFLHWVREEMQRREIEGARKWLQLDPLPVSLQQFDYPGRLYSALRRRIAGLDTRRASPQQWRHTLLNLRRDGLRDEELQWSGVLEFLERAQQGGRKAVERQELLDAIDLSPIRMEMSRELVRNPEPQLAFVEVSERVTALLPGLAGVPETAEAVCVLRHHDRTTNYRVGVLRQRRRPPGSGDAGHWFALAPHGQAIPVEGEPSRLLHPDAASAIRAANRHARRNVRLRAGTLPHRRYPHMCLHGGSDHHEWLVTLPDYAHSFFNGHYYERNLLLHIRSDERRDVTGRRLLFIEEIQSDWHQAGAKLGYDSHWHGRVPLAPFRREWVSLGLKLMLLHALERGCDGIAWADGAVQEARYGKALPPLRRQYDQEMPRLLERLARPWGGRVERTAIRTHRPGLHTVREGDHWYVTDRREGGLRTRARFTRDQAIALITRHSAQVDLGLPVLWISEGMRERIAAEGLPLFGEQPS